MKIIRHVRISPSQFSRGDIVEVGMSFLAKIPPAYLKKSDSVKFNFKLRSLALIDDSYSKVRVWLLLKIKLKSI